VDQPTLTGGTHTDRVTRRVSDCLTSSERRPLEVLLTEYEEECAFSRHIVGSLDLDDLQEYTPPQFKPVSVRWIVTHMIDETARHLGHLDLLREMTDGAKSY
jgi:hypothetical protein